MVEGKTGRKKTLSTIALILAALLGLWEVTWLTRSSLAFVLMGLAAAVCLLAWANLAEKE